MKSCTGGALIMEGGRVGEKEGGGGRMRGETRRQGVYI